MKWLALKIELKDLLRIWRMRKRKESRMTPRSLT